MGKHGFRQNLYSNIQCSNGSSSRSSQCFSLFYFYFYFTAQNLVNQLQQIQFDAYMHTHTQTASPIDIEITIFHSFLLSLFVSPVYTNGLQAIFIVIAWDTYTKGRKLGTRRVCMPIHACMCKCCSTHAVIRAKSCYL